MSLRSVHLHGHLAERFGPVYRLDVATPKEAVRALIVQLPGFRKVLAEGEYRIVRGDLRPENDLDRETLGLRLGAKDVHIVPVLAGSKRGGVGKAILGTVIIAAAIIFAPAALPAAALDYAGASAATGLSAEAFTIFGSSVTFGSIALFGGGMVLSGVAQMLSPQPKVGDPGQFEPADQRASFVFNGPVNAAEQGAPVPLIYGEMTVGSVVVASGLEAIDIGT